MRTDSPPPLSSHVVVSLYLPPPTPTLTFEGTVVYVAGRSHSVSSGDSVETGIRFSTLDFQQQGLLRGLLLKARSAEAVSRSLSREEVKDRYRLFVNPSVARILSLMGSGVEALAEGAIIQDREGKRYLDASGGFGVFNLGHRHPKVIDRVRAQLETLPLSSKVMYNEAVARLAELLAMVTPGNLQYSFLCNSGAEAVEGALKLARAATRRAKFISAHNAFHGKTLGALSATGREMYRKPFAPLLEEFTFVPFGDVVALERTIDVRTAAVILEPIQGEGGVILPPPTYLRKARDLCTAYDALLILDEVQTGLGRTGRMFAMEHWEIVPDLLTLGKALGGGVLPVGAFMGTERVWQPLIEEPFLHTSTFGGNPLACTAATETIKVLLEEELPEKAAKKGSYLSQGLMRLQTAYPELIRDVRGIGLLFGIELNSPAMAGRLIAEARKWGMLLAFTLNDLKVIRIEPPLTIAYEDLDRILTVLENSLRKLTIVT